MARRAEVSASHSGRTHGVKHIDLSSVQVASSETARDINRDIVLELIRFRQPVSRVDLSRMSGMQPSTISLIVEQLIEEEWVREGAVIRGMRGRPSTMLAVNEDLVTIALDLRPDRAIIAVIDISGRFLTRETVVTGSDPEVSMERIASRMTALREQYRDKSFEGIGVSVPGRVHPETQKLLLAPNLHWSDYDIKAELSKKTGLQVEVDNDANACLLSEMWNGRLAGVQTAVLVALSEGLGTAILTGGVLHSGFNGLGGEFGHIPIDPAGPKCGCGQRGCWEMFASSRAAMRFYKEAGGSAAKNVYELIALAEEGDRRAVKAVQQQAKALGRGLRLITAALSPERILIIGEITSAWDKFGPLVQKEMEATMLAGSAPALVTAGDGELARLSGASAMLLQRHTHYHRSTHAAGKGRRRLPNVATRKAS
jgi:predicted NBD/HSP70 family sugar kinase